jgi:hypothetical protein
VKSQDLMNKDNERARIVDILIEVCSKHDLSYSYNEKQFKISLPNVEPVSVLPQDVPGAKKRRRWNFLKPDPKGYDESAEDVNMPDELPPTTTPLDEGEAPKGDEEK